MANISRCNKFEANIFNKAKCQHCFKPKEHHSAEALARNKDARKISKCGYLFVAPESFNFSNPLDRTRRWQRRFFVLFDDGELTYSVDENVNTVPQGVVDMNTCTDVFDAEEVTSHPLSVAVTTKEKCIYIKGMSKDESNRWHDVLVMYPRSTKTHRRRSPQPPLPQAPVTASQDRTASIKRSERRQRTSYPLTAGAWAESQVQETPALLARPPVGPGAEPVTNEASTYRSIRSMKHQNDPTFKDRLAKSSSHPDLSSDYLPAGDTAAAPRRSSESRDALSSPSVSPAYTTRSDVSMPKTLFESLVSEERPAKPVTRSGRYIRLAGIPQSKSIENYVGDAEINSRSRSRMRRRSSPLEDMRGAVNVVSDTARWWEERTSPRSSSTPSPCDLHAHPSFNAKPTCTVNNPRDRIRRKLSQGTARSSSLPSYRNLSSHGQDAGKRRSSPSPDSPGVSRSAGNSPRHQTTPLLNGHTKNETDETKMARSSDLMPVSPLTDLTDNNNVFHDDLMYIKKGWLVKLGSSDKDWSKHWFVLSGTTLSYFDDANAEDAGSQNGVIDLKTCSGVEETKRARNYGFLLKLPGEEMVLSAMTMGIRSNWMQAIEKCIPPDAVTDVSASYVSTSPALRDRRSRRYISMPLLGTDQPDGNHVEEASDVNVGSELSEVRVPRGRDARSRHTMSSCTWASVVPAPRDTQKQSNTLLVKPQTVSNPERRDEVLRRTPEQEAELDDVERNIRVIHRKSISNSLNQHKPPHLDRFENGIAPSADDTEDAVSSRPPTRHSQPHTESNISTKPANDASSRRKSESRPPHHFRAPSAKIKDRSRAKSPRAKSPPPQQSLEDLVDRVVLGNADTDISSELVHRSWSQPVESSFERIRQDSELSGASTPAPDSEASLTQSDTHRLLEEGKDALDELVQVQAKLDVAMSELAKAEVGLSSSAIALQEEQEASSTMQEHIDDLESQLKSMEKKVKRYEANLQGIQEMEKEMTELRREFSLKSSHLKEQKEELRLTKEQLQLMEDQLLLADDEAASHRGQLEKSFIKEQERLEEEVRLLRRQMEKNKDSLSASASSVIKEKDHTIAQLEERLIENDKKVEELMEELTMEAEDHSKLQETYSNLDKEFNLIKDQYQEIQQEMAHYEDDMKDIQAEKHELFLQKNEGETKNQMLKTDLAKVEEQFHKQQQEYDGMVQDMERMERELREANKVLENREGELEDAVNNLSHSTCEMENIQELYLAAQKKLESRTDWSQSDDKLSRLERELEASVQDRDELRKEVGSLKEQLDQQEAQFEEALKERDIVQQELKQILQNYDAQHSSLERELSEARSQATAVQENLAAQQRSSTQDTSNKDQKLLQLEQLVDELREKLVTAEAALRQQVEMMEKLNNSPAAPVEANSRDKYERTEEDLKKILSKTQSLEKSLSEAESCNSKLKVDIKNTETGYQDQLSSLSAKVSSLTTKLEAAERRAHRFDRKRTLDVLDNGSQTEHLEGLVAVESRDDHDHTISELQKQVMEYDLKCQELSSKILRQHDFGLELDHSRNREDELKKEVEALKERVPYVDRSRLADVNMALEVREIQKKLSQKQSAIDDCTSKLMGLLEQLEGDDVNTRDESDLTSQLQDILNLMQSDSEMLDAHIPAGPEGRLRIFAEKMALEALVITELAHVVDQNKWLEDGPYFKLYTSMAAANHRIQLLDKRLCAPDKNQLQTLPQHSSSRIRVLSDLLAEKILVQSYFDAQCSQLSVEDDTQPITDSASLIQMAEVALDKATLDNQLSVQSSQMVAPITSVPCGALIQCELVHVLLRLKTTLASITRSDDKLTCMKQEIHQTYQALQKHEAQVMDKVEGYTSTKIVELAKLMVLLENNSTKAGFDNEFLETELCHVTKACIEKCVTSYLQETNQGSDIPEFLEVISKAINQDISKVAAEISDAYNQLSQPEVELNLDDSYGIDVDFSDMSDRHDAVGLNERRSTCLMQLATVMSQKAVLTGQLAALSHVVQEADLIAAGKTELTRADSGLPMSPVLETSPSGTGLSKALSAEAQGKSQIALFLLNKGDHEMSSDVQTEIMKLASELSSLEGRIKSTHNNTTYQELMRDAISQAEKTFIRQYLALKHQQEMDQLQQDLEAQLKASQSNHDDQIQQLETEIGQLGSLLSENEHLMQLESHDADETVSQLQSEMERKEAIHLQEVKALKEGYDIRIRSLQADLETAQSSLDSSLHDKDELVNKLEDQFNAASRELKTVQADHQEALLEKERQQVEYERRLAVLEEQVKEGHEGEAEAAEGQKHKLEALTEEVDRLKKQLGEERVAHMTELSRLQSETESDGPSEVTQSLLNAKIQQLQSQIENLQGDYEQELALQRAAHRRELSRCKEDLMQLLAAAESQTPHLNEENLRKRYLKDIDSVKDLYDKGFVTMDRSHQRVQMQMRLAHKQELEKLRQEKDQLLMEETKATQAALDAMRKAHEEELQKERNKFLDLIAKTYSQAELENLQSQHEDDMQLVQWELRQLTEQFSIRCLEAASLKERLELQTKALHGTRQRNHELMAMNDELSCRMKHEIERLKRMTDKECPSDDQSPEVAKLKVGMRVKDTEIDQLKDDIVGLHHKLNESQQELEESRIDFTSLESEHNDSSRQYQKKVEELERQVSSLESTSLAQLSEADISSLLNHSGVPESAAAAVAFSASTPKVSSSEAEDASSSPTAGTQPLPQVATEVKVNKKSLWRQKQPKRAMSNPAIPARHRLSLPNVAETLYTESRLLSDVSEAPGGASELYTDESASSSPRSIAVNVVDTI